MYEATQYLESVRIIAPIPLHSLLSLHCNSALYYFILYSHTLIIPIINILAFEGATILCSFIYIGVEIRGRTHSQGSRGLPI